MRHSAQNASIHKKRIAGVKGDNGLVFLLLIHPTPLSDIHFQSSFFTTDFNRFAWNLIYKHILLSLSLDDTKAFDFEEREAGVSDSGVCPSHRDNIPQIYGQ